MSATDPFSSEARDRRSEVASFVGAGLLGLTVPIALAAVPLQPINLVVILALGLIAILFFMRGMAARQHRLNMAKEASELRARLLESAEDLPSAQ